MPRIRLLTVAGVLLWAACVLFCAETMAQDPVDRFEQLQRQIDEQAGQIQTLESQRESNTGDSSVDPTLERLQQALVDIDTDFLEGLSQRSRRIVNGRIHVDQWNFPDSSKGINVIENGDPKSDPQDRLLFRRLRIGVRGTVPPGNMSYRLELDFSGQEGSQFRDAWIGWDDLVFFDTVRIGNQKRPYGLDQLNSSNFNVFLERPSVTDAFNENNRRFGLAVYGASDDQAYNWRYGVFNQTLIQDSGATITDDLAVELAWRLANTWWYDETSDGRGYGHWALAGTFAFPGSDLADFRGENNRARFRSFPEGRSSGHWLDTGFIEGGDAYQILGLETVFNVGAFQFTAEYMNLWLQRSHAESSSLFLHGGYFYVSYFLTGEHIPWNRRLGILGRVEPFENFFHVETCEGCTKRGMGAWQVAARLSHANFNDGDILGGIGSNLTLALNWYWNAHARM